MSQKIKSIISSIMVLSMFITLFSGVLLPASVNAASLIAVSDTLSSSKISATSSHAIRFTTPTGTSVAGATIIITFPTDFNFTSKTIGTVTFTHGATTGLESSETLAAAASATVWGAVFSGTQNRILTLTAPTDGVGTAALAASDKVIITYSSVNSINASTAASYNVTVGGTFGDTGSATINLLTDDQVSVSALVSQSLTFSISDNTIGFGALSPSAARFATGDTLGGGSEVEANNIVVGTNASNGYSLSLAGSTLTSNSDTITAIGASNTASSIGSEQFGLRATATGGTGTVTAPYAASGFAFVAGQVAAATGATANTTYSMRYIANIATLTEAGSYATSLTYTATANF